jgi:hypothetical protein
MEPSIDFLGTGVRASQTLDDRRGAFPVFFGNEVIRRGLGGSID